MDITSSFVSNTDDSNAIPQQNQTADYLNNHEKPESNPCNFPSSKLCEDTTIKDNQFDMDIFKKLIHPMRRSLVDGKFALHNVGHDRWKIISKDISTADFDLWRGLFEIGKRNLKPDTSLSIPTFMCCGEEMYLKKIRPELIKNQLINVTIPGIDYPIINSSQKKDIPEALPPSQSNKGKMIHNPKKGNKIIINKSDKIKQDNLEKKIKIELDTVIKSIYYDKQLKTTPVNSIVYLAKYVELVLVRMMHNCKNLCSKYKILKKSLTEQTKSKYKNNNDIVELLKNNESCKKELTELIVGYNKIFIEKKNNSSISQTCVSDLNDWVEYAKKIINFDPIDVVMRIPELIFKTIYDGMLEHKQSGLYQSQKEIFEFVTTTPSYLALVHTMLGSGKTSIILPLCGWLITNRKTKKSKILFSCPNEVVLLEVAQMVYGMGVSFAIVVYDEKNNKLVYKWSSFADSKNPKDTAILYLCDIFVARILLEERLVCLKDRNLYLEANKRDPDNYPLSDTRIPYVPNYILIGDELTKDADTNVGFGINSGFSLTTEVTVDLMKIAPDEVILMSATLPTYEQLPKLYNAIIDARPGMVVRSFTSSEAKIGCALISNSGEVYAPHIGCETIEHLKHILITIKTNPFIGRFYTVEVLMEMIDTFKRLGLSVPDLSILFNNPAKANQTNIQQIAYGMLNDLIEIELKRKDEDLIDANNIKPEVDLGCLLFDDKIPDENLDGNTELSGSITLKSNIINSDASKKISSVPQLDYCEIKPTTPKDIIKQACTMKKTVGKGVDLNNIFMTDRFSKGCLIFTSDPVATALKVYQSNFDKYLNANAERNIFEQVRMDTILRKYEKEMELFNKALTRISEKKDTSMTKQNKDNNKKENMVTDSWKITSKMMGEKPTWDFPEELQIFSLKHLTKLKCDTSNISGTICPEDLPKNTNVSVDILTMLASGIGIYSTNSTVLDDNYLKTILFLAKRGLIKMIFTDSSIAYGTNLAVSNIIMIDEMMDGVPSIIDKHSMKTIFQMLGRAGRGGNLSYEARIYTVSPTDNLINMIKSYTNGTLNEGNKDEIHNIGRAFDIIWNESSIERTDTHQKQIIKKTQKQKKNFGTYGGVGRR